MPVRRHRRNWSNPDHYPLPELVRLDTLREGRSCCDLTEYVVSFAGTRQFHHRDIRNFVIITPSFGNPAGSVSGAAMHLPPGGRGGPCSGQGEPAQAAGSRFSVRRLSGGGPNQGSHKQ